MSACMYHLSLDMKQTLTDTQGKSNEHWFFAISYQVGHTTKGISNTVEKARTQSRAEKTA